MLDRRDFLAAAALATVANADAAPQLAVNGGTPVRTQPLGGPNWGPQYYDDKEQVIAHVGDHEVIQHSTGWVREECIALSARFEADEVRRGEPLQSACRFRNSARSRPQGDLTHVRDVEQSRCGARVQMLFEYAGWKVERHLVTGEGHHARAEIDVQAMQGRAP